MNIIEIQRRSKMVDFVIVDDCDYSEMQKYKWHITSRTADRTQYARCHITDSTGTRKPIRMHNLIMSCPEGYEVDHCNGNGLDNRRQNLKIVSHAENMQNLHRRHKHNKPRKTKVEAVQEAVQEVEEQKSFDVASFFSRLRNKGVAING